MMSENNNQKGRIIGSIIAVLAVLGLFGMCSGGDDKDGKCDNAGCSNIATCTFGDMELCLTHYISWSSRARD